MMQLTGQNRFTRSLSGGYKMTNGSHVYASYSLRTGEAIKKCSKFVSQLNSIDERVEDGKSMAMPNELYKQCRV